MAIFLFSEAFLMTNFTQYTQSLPDESWLVYHLSFAPVLNWEQVCIQMQSSQLKQNLSHSIAVIAFMLYSSILQNFPITIA